MGIGADIGVPVQKRAILGAISKHRFVVSQDKLDDKNIENGILSMGEDISETQYTSNSTDNHHTFYSFLAGGIAGSISSALTCPIEVVKTQLQSSNTTVKNPRTVAYSVYHTHGLKGFFRGLVPTLIGIFPSRACYFFTYEHTKRYLIPVFGDSSATHLTSGLCAGIVGNTITNPIWMLKTRMQILADANRGQVVYRGYKHAAKLIRREEGIRGFYKGLSASYWGCSEGCIQFMLYEKLKCYLKVRHQLYCQKNRLTVTEQLPSYQYFLSAAICKFVATVSVYPHEVARTRLREQAKHGVFRYKSMWQTIILIAREEGKTGLYSGIGTHLLRVVPNTAIMFSCYELISSWLRAKGGT